MGVRVVRYAHEDPELMALVRRYVTPERRYMKLGGNVLGLEGAEYERFVRRLSDDARAVTAPEIALLFDGSWRERRTAAWLVAVARRTEFREVLGDLLLASETCLTGLAYCVALAGFGTPRDADLLAAYLDRYLRRPDLGYDQTMVMGALLYTDLRLGDDRAARFLRPGGLWHQWIEDAPHMSQAACPDDHLPLVRRLCACIDDCAQAIPPAS